MTPTYLTDAIILMRRMEGPTETEFAKFLNAALSSEDTLSILRQAYLQIVESGDQDLLIDACVDRNVDERGELQRLLVIFERLGESGIAPFATFECRRHRIKLVRAERLPDGVDRFLAFGRTHATSSEELRLISQMETFSTAEIQQLHGLGQQLSGDAEFAKRVQKWLRRDSETVEAEIIQRVLYWLELLGYQW